MAYLIANNTFHPYSFDEMLKPLALYGQEYARQEAGLAELGAQAGPLEVLASSPKDSKEYQQYQNYMVQLNSLSDKLASQGLSPETRRGLSDMSKLYRTTITPIQDSINKREELDKEWRATKGKDASWIGSRPADLSLSEIAAGDYSKLYGASGQDVENEALIAAKAASERQYNELEPVRALFNQYIETGMEQGFNPEDTDRILSNIDASSELGQAIQKIREGSDYYKMNKAEQDQFNARLFSGVFNGLEYNKKVDYHKNLDLERAIDAEQLKQARIKTRAAAGAATTEVPSDVPYKPYFDETVNSSQRANYEALVGVLSNIENMDNVSMLNQQTDIKNGASLLATLAVPGGSVSAGIPYLQATRDHFTYGEILDMISKDYGIDIDITYDENGNITSLSGPEQAKQELANLINDSVTMSKGLVMTSVSDNKNIINHLNTTTQGLGRTGLITTTKGKRVSSDFEFDTNKPAYVKFTPEGDLVVKQDGKEHVVSPEAISASPSITVASLVKDGSLDLTHSTSVNPEYGIVTNNYTPLKAQERYKEILSQLKSKSLTPAERSTLMDEASNLAVGLMDTLYGEANSYARKQSETLPSNEQ